MTTPQYKDGDKLLTKLRVGPLFSPGLLHPNQDNAHTAVLNEREASIANAAFQEALDLVDSAARKAVDENVWDLILRIDRGFAVGEMHGPDGEQWFEALGEGSTLLQALRAAAEGTE